jgi:hypothetical protein
MTTHADKIAREMRNAASQFDGYWPSTAIYGAHRAATSAPNVLALLAEHDALKSSLASMSAAADEDAAEIEGKQRCIEALAKEKAALKALLEKARGALEPFARGDGAIGDEEGPFRFETLTGHRIFERGDLRAARALLAEIEAVVKGKPGV